MFTRFASMLGSAVPVAHLTRTAQQAPTPLTCFVMWLSCAPELTSVQKPSTMCRSRLFNVFSALLLGILAMGCHKKESGTCPEPHETVTWFWMEDSGPLGTEYKCVHCDASHTPTDPNETPCFYTYPSGGWKDPDSCKADVCSDSPTTKDPVTTAHGVWVHIKPLLSEPLEPGQSLRLEGSILLTTPPPQAPPDTTATGGGPLDASEDALSGSEH